MSCKVAVIGATGNVGRELLKILHERAFPVTEVVALSSAKSVGTQISFGDEAVLTSQNLADYSFQGTDFSFFCAGSKVSQVYAPQACAAGSVVIDKSSYFRLDPGVPLIVPEVNFEKVPNPARGTLISNPNCVALPLSVILKPLNDLSPIKRCVLATYQSVSGAGKEAMDELYNQTKSVFMNGNVEPSALPKHIAFNLIPQISYFEADGSTEEETKIIYETRKILGTDIKVSVTSVRVPVFIGHSMAVNLEFENPITPSQARKALTGMPGIMVIDRPENESYATPIDAAGEDVVMVSRIRKDTSVAHGLNLWICCDNLRKGAALNAVQIAEAILKQ